jgi:hypothetical protein
MDCKFFVAQALVDLLHFVERIAHRRPRRVENPRTFGASAALKARLFNPNQLAEYDHLGTPPEVREGCHIFTVRSLLGYQVNPLKANQVNPLKAAA